MVKSQLTDTHAHLNFNAFQNDLDGAISRARKSGVGKIIVVGANLDSSRQGIMIANQHQGVFATVGIHPHHAAAHPDLTSLETKLGTLFKNSVRIVALGETGLDYHHYQNQPPVDRVKLYKVQAPLFKLHLKLAREHNLPVIIHCREAWPDLWKLFLNHAKGQQSLQGVFHCWSGNLNDLHKALSINFFISFTGNLTYPQNVHLQRLAKAVPLTKLLLETDAPFMAPQERRGQRCEPADLPLTAAFLANLKKVPLEKLVKQTTANAQLLFGLSTPKEVK